MKKKIELLAPAGNMECLIAAIEAGADAVYLGGYMFGARAFAGNFSNDEIIDAIKYAHTYGVKVYVTVNTLIYEDEVPTFINYVDFLHQNNVDAILIQDIGMLHLLKTIFPNLEIHASTQMHLHNLESVKFAEKQGITRAVLARETSIDLIKEIKEKTSIELETFVHGALCISYSGQCLMSSMIGGRSANRGACAGSCRLSYDVVDQNNNVLNTNKKYPLSLKDLLTLENIKELIDLGVDSLKIEGRMKRKEYVYLVVSLYRKAIDSYYKDGKVNITKDDIKQIKKLYNRYFTKGFLFNSSNRDIVNGFRPNHMGIKVGTVVECYQDKIKIKLDDKVNIKDGLRIVGTNDYGFNLNVFKLNNKIVKSAEKGDTIEVKVKDKIKVGSDVLKTTEYEQIEKIDKLIDKKLRKINITIKVFLKLGEKIKLELSDGKNVVKVESHILVEEASKHPITKENIIEKVSKFGNTPFNISSIDINMSDNIFIPIKELNNLRRVASDKLISLRQYKTDYKRNIYNYQNIDVNVTNQVNIKISDEESYNSINKDRFDTIYVDNYEIYQKIKDNKKVCFIANNVILNHKEFNSHIMVGELGGINKYRDVDSDYSLNVVNSYSVYFLHSLGVKKVTLSYELDIERMKDIVINYKKRYKSAPNLEVIVSSYPKLMTSKYNLYKEYDKDKLFLKDRFNNKYKIINKDNLMNIYDYKLINTNIEEIKNTGITNIRYQINDSTEVKNLNVK